MTVGAILILKALLEILYVNFVHEYFIYNGFHLDVNYFKFIETFIFTIVLSIFIANIEKYKKPSRIVIYILFINLFIPISILYWMRDESRVFYITAIVFFAILIAIVTRIKVPNIPKPTLSNKVILGSSIVFTIVVYSFLIYTGGLSRFNLNLLDVYETREAYANVKKGYFSYFVTWQAHIVNMFFLVYGVFRRNKWVIGVALLLQVFLFSMTNFKSHLFIPIAVLAVLFIGRMKFKNLLFLILSGISGGLITLYILFIINNNNLLLSIFVRRLFFVPANLHYVYYDYFSQHEKYYLINTIVGKPFKYFMEIEVTNPVQLIAQEVFGRDFSPNVGVIADAYLNFGIYGVVIFALILGIYLLIMDGITESMDAFSVMALILMPSMALVNSALFTSLITHGLVPVLILLWVSHSLFEEKIG